jgi:hypothetical protein
MVYAPGILTNYLESVQQMGFDLVYRGIDICHLDGRPQSRDEIQIL